MKNKLLYIILLLFPYITFGQTISNIKRTPINVNSWIVSHFARGKTPPFSFTYNGIPSVSFIKKWEYHAINEKSENPDIVKYIFTYKDPTTKIKVECNVKGYTNSNAIEWYLHFTNENKVNSPEIANISTANISFHYGHSGNFRLHYLNGSNAKKNDFAPKLKILANVDSIYMRPGGGRSSQDILPFFNIESPTKQGIVVAIGWTGTWFTDIHSNCNKNISLKTGIERLKTFLYPNETIRTSSISMLFWNGADYLLGNNAFRHFVLKYHTRMINGRPITYPISSSFNYGDPAPCNEYTCLTDEYAIAMVKRYKQFNLVPEVFWLDAGWYAHSADISKKRNWANTVGYWTVDSVRFPKGLRNISDEVHKVGAKFMVWFEPERVYKDTKWANEHPEWLLKINGNNNYLFNLGNPIACKWLCKYIGDFIENNGIDYYRQDFNIEPEKYWKSHDEPGRQGMCEMQYIEGLYYYWDYLLNRFPNLLIDNCASGGRRIDLETISRSAPLWRTDYNFGEPNGYQCHTYGLELFLPLHGTGIMGTNKYDCRSSLGTSVIYDWKITDKKVSLLDMQDMQKEFKDIRPYFYEDYYPLSGIENITSDSIWLAYQLYRKSDDSGYIIAFRRQNNSDKYYNVKLSGLKPTKIYVLTNKDTGETIRKSGKELSECLTLSLESTRSSIIIKYQ